MPRRHPGIDNFGARFVYRSPGGRWRQVHPLVEKLRSWPAVCYRSGMLLRLPLTVQEGGTRICRFATCIFQGLCFGCGVRRQSIHVATTGESSQCSIRSVVRSRRCGSLSSKSGAELRSRQGDPVGFRPAVVVLAGCDRVIPDGANHDGEAVPLNVQWLT